MGARRSRMNAQSIRPAGPAARAAYAREAGPPCSPRPRPAVVGRRPARRLGGAARIARAAPARIFRPESPADHDAIRRRSLRDAPDATQRGPRSRRCADPRGCGRPLEVTCGTARCAPGARPARNWTRRPSGGELERVEPGAPRMLARSSASRPCTEKVRSRSRRIPAGSAPEPAGSRNSPAGRRPPLRGSTGAPRRRSGCCRARCRRRGR